MAAQLDAVALDMPLATPAITHSTYDRHHPAGVVHLGLGAFHRCHQALVFDQLLQSGDMRWGVVGVGMRASTLVNTLREQDGWYPVRFQSAAPQWHWVGAVVQTLMASSQRAEVVAAISAPSTRWLTLTVTEKGYTAELATLLVDGLRQRFANSLPGLTVASCDNVHHNGDALKVLCLNAASLELDFLSWLHSDCRFPNSMVDRMVPAASDALAKQAAAELGAERSEGAIACEAFWEWVIEDQFADPSDAHALRQAGVMVVPDASPYEQAKLSLLNGAHSAIAYVSLAAGWHTVAEFMSKPAARHWLQQLMTQELALGTTRPDCQLYIDSLLARFSNPALAHQVLHIAADASQKIPQRWVTAIVKGLEQGLLPRHLALAAAAWMQCVVGIHTAGQRLLMADPIAHELQALVQQAGLRSDLASANDTVQTLGRMQSIWGAQIASNSQWLAAVAQALQELRERGAGAVMQQTLVHRERCYV